MSRECDEASLDLAIDAIREAQEVGGEQLEFADLCRDIQGALEGDPAGPRAQELAGRWLQLLAAFAPQGKIDPQLLKYQAAYVVGRPIAS